MTETGRKHWYVVHTQPNAELKAAAHIARQGFETYVPRYLKTRRHARRVETVTAAFFPRYLFVAIGAAGNRWRALNSTVGVSRVVMFGDGPAPIDGGIVEALKRGEDSLGFLSMDQLTERLKAGDRVRIREGAFAEYCGLFMAATENDRVAILLDLLGRKVRVLLEAQALELA